MGRWLSVSFHLTWPLQGQIGHTVSRRSAAGEMAPSKAAPRPYPWSSSSLPTWSECGGGTGGRDIGLT